MTGVWRIKAISGSLEEHMPGYHKALGPIDSMTGAQTKPHKEPEPVCPEFLISCLSSSDPLYVVFGI